MRRPRCFVFDLPLSLRSSRPSNPKRKIRLYYMYDPPASLTPKGFQRGSDFAKVGKLNV